MLSVSSSRGPSLRTSITTCFLPLSQEHLLGCQPEDVPVVCKGGVLQHRPEPRGESRLAPLKLHAGLQGANARGRANRGGEGGAGSHTLDRGGGTAGLLAVRDRVGASAAGQDEEEERE